MAQNEDLEAQVLPLRARVEDVGDEERPGNSRLASLRQEAIGRPDPESSSNHGSVEGTVEKVSSGTSTADGEETDQKTNRTPRSPEGSRQNVHPPASDPANAPMKSTTPPEDQRSSSDGSSRGGQPGRPTPARLWKEITGAYWDFVGALSHRLPHWKKLLHDPHRPAHCCITVWDHDGTNWPLREPLDWSSNQATPLDCVDDFCRKLRDDFPAGTVTRVILCEDLTPAMIGVLGTTFGINPNVFAAHLAHSGYQFNHYDLPEPSGTSSHSDHLSVRWYRPMRWSQNSFGLETAEAYREALLEPDDKSEPWYNFQALHEKEDKVQRKGRALTNIWRPAWHVAADYHNGDEFGSPCVLEERATIWTVEINDCQIVLALLDPLPAVQEVLLGPASRHAPNRYSFPRVRWRRARQAELLDSGMEPDDPLQDAEPIQDPSRDPWRNGQLLESEANYVRAIFPFIEMVSRDPLVAEKMSLVDFRTHTARYQKAFRTRSTRSTCTKWLQQWSQQSLKPCGPMIILWALVRILHHDTISYLQQIETSLAVIAEQMLDDVLLQERLQQWKSLIHRFQTTLPQLETSQDGLFQMISDAEDEQMHGHNHRAVSNGRLGNLKDDLERRIRDAKKQADKTSKSSMANLAIIESKRGIAEAESVTKLTELAFLFIPLTFSASLFSMQLNELRGGAPIYVFVIVAGVILSSSYSLRLLVRSRAFRTLKQRCLRAVRDHSDLRSDEAIPTSAYIRYLVDPLSAPTDLLFLMFSIPRPSDLFRLLNENSYNRDVDE
ncbi:MAG: hypothetical protein M1823_005679 [Watsoniomyces obsoletus]|nr:MAG: hypothetical protein M1823_005679 [Watsoniomyces obsoletus]